MYDFWVRGRNAAFLRVDEVRWLMDHAKVVVGAHSHLHDVVLTDIPPKKPNSPWKRARLPGLPEAIYTSCGIRSRLAKVGVHWENGTLVPRTRSQWERDVRRDTEQCLAWFDKHLGLRPESYCFPFNEFSDDLVVLLQAYGFHPFFRRTAQQRLSCGAAGGPGRGGRAGRKDGMSGSGLAIEAISHRNLPAFAAEVAA
jgi:hypothetical protein